MPHKPSTHFSFTAPINPPSATSTLSRELVWAALDYKVRHAEKFVGGAILDTNVLSESTDDFGRKVITREVVFAEGNRKVKEICTFFEGCKVEFEMPEGSKVINILADGADGQLYLTYQFDWFLPADQDAETQKATAEKWRAMPRGAVMGSLKAMRELVADGTIKV